MRRQIYGHPTNLLGAASTPVFLLNRNYYGPANVQRVTNQLLMKILTTLSQPNDEHGILPNSKLSTTNGKKSQTPIVCWARADREMLSIRHFPRLDGLLSRPFELRNPPASSSTSLPGTEVRWGVVRSALATAMAGYCKDDPRLGLAGSPVLERNALGIPLEGCCWRISVDAWLTHLVGIVAGPLTWRIATTGFNIFTSCGFASWIILVL